MPAWLKGFGSRRSRLALIGVVAAILVGNLVMLATGNSSGSDSVLAKGPQAGQPNGSSTSTLPGQVVPGIAGVPGPPGTPPPTTGVPRGPAVATTRRPTTGTPAPTPQTAPPATAGLWPAFGPKPQALRPILFSREGPIYAVNPDGTGEHKLADFGSHPSWSPDGSKIVYRGQGAGGCGTSNVWIMNADGSNQHRVPSAGPSPGCVDEYYPNWSPDGARIAYLENSATNNKPGLYVMNNDGSGRQFVCACSTSVVGPWDDGPSWSPDGSRLLVTAWEGGAVLYMVNADGSGKTKIADNARGAHWSRDGEHVVFTRELKDTTLALFVLDRLGTLHQVTATRAYHPNGSVPPWNQVDVFPQWSPDGGTIVFGSNRDHLDDNSSPVELFTMKSDGSGVKKITSKPASGPRVDWPAW